MGLKVVGMETAQSATLNCVEQISNSSPYRICTCRVGGQARAHYIQKRAEGKNGIRGIQRMARRDLKMVSEKQVLLQEMMRIYLRL